jgi:hypothetical protein
MHLPSFVKKIINMEAARKNNVRISTMLDKVKGKPTNFLSGTPKRSIPEITETTKR